MLNAKIILRTVAAAGLLTLGLLADAKPAAAIRMCPTNEWAYCNSLPADPIVCSGTTYRNPCMAECHQAPFCW